HRRQRESAGPDHAAVLEGDDQARHHRLNLRRPVLLAHLGAAQRRGLQEHLQVEARGRPGAVQPTSDRDVAAGVPGADRGVAADEGETHDKTCGLTTFSGTPPVSLVATCFATRLRKFASDSSETNAAWGV